MSTLDHPFDELPPTMLSEDIWVNWNLDNSPASSTSMDENISCLDFVWQPPVWSFPAQCSSPSDNWPSQCSTPISTTFPANSPVEMPQLPDDRILVGDWLPSFNTCAFGNLYLPNFTSPSLSRDMVHQYSRPQDEPSPSPLTVSKDSNPPSLATSNTAHTAPSLPSKNPTPKRNQVTKSPIRCFEHSCGGRAFSSPGNYERHLREKSGRARSFTCEMCGQKFTRSTAKNKHVRFGRCRMHPSR